MRRYKQGYEKPFKYWLFRYLYKQLQEVIRQFWPIKSIKKYEFIFSEVPKEEIRKLIEKEISNFQEGSSEYIRVLCGYLYCIGDFSDVSLMEKAKYSINMDVGCMIDEEWIDSLKGIKNEYTRPRAEIIESFIAYYKNFEADDDEW